MADMIPNDPLAPQPDDTMQTQDTTVPGQLSDSEYLDLFKRWKAESFDQRWVFERQWLRNLYYILNRQWIYYDTRRGQWQDKRLAKWVPRPVTNKCKDILQAIRAMFTAINIGANARPRGEDPKNITASAVADDYAPLLHEDHKMDQVMSEFDFWYIVLGNAFIHTCVDYDRANGVVNVQTSTCADCGEMATDDQIVKAGQKCPSCGSTNLQPVIDPATGMPKIDQKPLPKGTTIALSPLEVAFPLTYERFNDVPYVIRMRWRPKYYYEQHSELKALVDKIVWQKSPSDRTMQIFKSLPFQNDLGMAPNYFGSGTGAQTEAEGIPEYDVWIKPCDQFPEGQVIRFAGDADPIVLHIESENLPGPLPFTDSQGTPLFPFEHAAYEHVGGRILGSSAIDPVIQKQDQLNQLDSMMLMIIMRMANPVWLEPKGAEVEKFTGEPGLVVKWNPLIAGGNAKPERIPGEEIPTSLFQIRKMIIEDIEESSGTFDIIKGSKPPGVDSYAGISLLVERGQSRFASAFKGRGTVYKSWFKFALEIEREFGEETRVRSVMSPTKTWTFETFKKADLAGDMDIVIEDGTLTPKSSLGERAAIEHLNQLKLIDASNPDTSYAIFQKFGQTKLVPGIDAQVQCALANMEKFEKFISNPQAINQAASTGKSPLVYKRWYNPQIHRAELIKWAIGDRGQATFTKYPASEQLVDAYLMEIDLAISQAAMGVMDAGGVMVPTQPGGAVPGAPGAPPPGPGGAGMAMANSNQNAGGAGPHSSSSAGTSQPMAQNGNQPAQRAA